MIVIIMSFYCVFNEKGMTHSIKSDIVQNSEIMNMMCSNSAIISLVNRIALNI